MTDIRTAAQQALEALGSSLYPQPRQMAAIAALKAALAEPDLFHCPKCGGPADNGHDRSIPPSPYWCTKCMAEPVQEPDDPARRCGGPGCDMRCCQPVQEPVRLQCTTCGTVYADGVPPQVPEQEPVQEPVHKIVGEG